MQKYKLPLPIMGVRMHRSITKFVISNPYGMDALYSFFARKYFSVQLSLLFSRNFSAS